MPYSGRRQIKKQKPTKTVYNGEVRIKGNPNPSTLINQIEEAIKLLIQSDRRLNALPVDNRVMELPIEKKNTCYPLFNLFYKRVKHHGGTDHKIAQYIQQLCANNPALKPSLNQLKDRMLSHFVKKEARGNSYFVICCYPSMISNFIVFLEDIKKNMANNPRNKKLYFNISNTFLWTAIQARKHFIAMLNNPLEIIHSLQHSSSSDYDDDEVPPLSQNEPSSSSVLDQEPIPDLQSILEDNTQSESIDGHDLQSVLEDNTESESVDDLSFSEKWNKIFGFQP